VAEVVGADPRRQPLVIDQRRQCLAERVRRYVGYAERFAGSAPACPEVVWVAPRRRRGGEDHRLLAEVRPATALLENLLRLVLAQLDSETPSIPFPFNDTFAEFADCPDCTRDVVECLAMLAAEEMTPPLRVNVQTGEIVGPDPEEYEAAERAAADKVARRIARWLDIAAKFNKRLDEP
jgi:hypothetical protein